MLDPGFLFAISTAFIGGIAWAVRVEGRVNGHDRLFEEREKQLEDRHAEVVRRLARIEEKQDIQRGPQ